MVEKDVVKTKKVVNVEAKKSLLNIVQTSARCPKNQFNSFGKYAYRSLEDICKAVRDVLKETGAALLVEDEVVLVGNRYYVKATAKLVDEAGTCVATTTGWAREAEAKKGMDEAQITGACSSYARKYALNALLCLDDTKDADAQGYASNEVTKKYDLSKYPEKEKIAGIEEHFKNKEGFKLVGDILYSPREFEELKVCEIKED